eukprot:Rhum_TRINITY_DN4366_c0_g1::Rhum_TRINITY_DN4366_c0_g1_i1::g.14103::m.14103/K11267/PDS5; sister chromatid cohesion protein PDS5
MAGEGNRLSGKALELSELSNGKALKRCPDVQIIGRLRAIAELLNDPAFKDEGSKDHLSGPAAVDLLTNNGFAKEILSPRYCDKDANDATQILSGCVIVAASALTVPTFLFHGKEKQVTKFLWRQFHHLQKAQPESETYSSVLEMFEGVVHLGLFGLLANDKEVESMLCEAFDIVLNKLTCRADSDVMLRGLMEDLLKGSFEDMSEVPASLLEVFLRPLERSSDKSQAATAARSVVKAVIRRLAQSMQDALCRHLTGKVDSLVVALSRASKEEQKEMVRSEIKPVFETILNVSEGHGGLNAQLLPHVAAHMEHANPLLRRLAVNWMSKLFVEHTTHWTEYRLLFNATLDSLRDGVKEIRLSAVRWYGDFIEKHRAALVDEDGVLQEAIANRIRNPLLDSDVDVRLKATQVLVELVSLKRALHLFPTSILEMGISRMTDTKSSVRKVAIREFGGLYRSIMEENDKVPEPYNQIPSKLLEVYACPTSRPDQRWEAEQAIVEYVLGEDEDAEEAAADDEGAKQRLAINMIKMWKSVPPAYRNAFAKMLTSKKSVREIAQVLPSLILTIRKLSKEWRAGGAGAQKPPELVKAELVFEKVVLQLHRSCGLRDGLEQMLSIKDESVLAETVTCLQQINDRPEDGIVLKGKLLSMLKKALKDTRTGKEVIEKVDVLLTRICFPIHAVSIRHMVSLCGQFLERHSGKRALQVSELLLVIAQSFPETFVSSKESVSALTDRILQMAEDEYATRSWGGEADLHSPLPPPADTSPGSVQRMTRQTLHERRETLRHLLLVFFNLLGGKQAGAAPAAAGGKKAKHSVFDALHTKKAVERLTKTLRKLALHTTEPIAKLAMRVLGRVIERPQSGASVGDLSGKADFMKAMLVDCERCLDVKKPCSYLTVTALRVAQQCVIQHPRPEAGLSKVTLKFVHELLPKLAAATIKTTKKSSYANPPLECSVYRTGLKFVTTCLLSAQDKTSSTAVKDVVDTYSSLLKLSGVTASGEPNIAKSIQTTDVTKSIIRLGRAPETFQILYGVKQASARKTWERQAYNTLFEGSAECRNEIGRVLHRDLMSGRLCLLFAQLLAMTLVDANRANYSAAKERVSDVIKSFRTRAARHRVQLDSPQAPMLCPEYIVPSLLHLLARWSNLEDLRPSFEPIQRLLFHVFDSLTEHKQCTGFLFDMILRIKKLDDALFPESTDTRMLADIAYLVLKSVTQTKEVKTELFPGAIHLPMLFSAPHSQEHREWGEDKIFINIKDFVPVTRKDAKKVNPAALGVDDIDEPSPARSPRRGVSPKKSPKASPKKSPKASPKKGGAKRAASKPPSASPPAKKTRK